MPGHNKENLHSIRLEEFCYTYFQHPSAQGSRPAQALNQMDSETGQEFVKRLKERPREEQSSFIFFPIETRLQLYQIAERQRINRRQLSFPFTRLPQESQPECAVFTDITSITNNTTTPNKYVQFNTKLTSLKDLWTHQSFKFKISHNGNHPSS